MDATSLRKSAVLSLASLTLCASAQQTASPAQDVQAPQASTYTLKINTDIVLTNVIVRDKKTGAVITGLKASDFTIAENNKPQRIASFDYQNVNDAAVLNEKTTVSGKASIADMLERNLAATPLQLRDHRAVRGAEPRRASRAGVRQQQAAAGGSRRARQLVDRPHHGPGLHRK